MLDPNRRIYHYDWRGEQTGWDYRLKIFKAYSGKFTDPGNEIEIVTLPAGCINPKKLESKFRQYPWGMPELPPKFSFEIYHEEIELGVDYDEFWDMIFDPVVTIPSGYSSFDMDAGTCYELWIKFNGCDLPLENGGYRLIYVGICRTSFKWQRKSNQDTTLIEVEDINKVIADNVDPTYWKNINQGSRLHKQGLIEYAIIGETDNYVIGHQKDNCSLYFRPLEFIDDVYQAWAEKCYQALRRDSTLTYIYTAPTFKAYRQLYDGSGGLGTELNYNELYVLSDIFESGAYKGGLLNDKSGLGVDNRYPNGAWDYLNEYYEQFWCKTICKPSGLFALPINARNGLSGIVAVAVDKRVELEYPSEVLSVKTATASHYEYLSDDYADISKYVANDKISSRNQGEITIPIVLNNMPSAVKYDQLLLLYGDTKLNLVKPAIFRRAWKPHALGLYYIEGNNSLVTSGEELVRIHEYIEFKVNNTVFSSAIPGCDFMAYNPLTDHTIDQPSEMMRDMQAFGTLSKYCALGMLELLKSNKLYTCKISADFDDYVSFDSGDMPGFLWMNPDVMISFDANDVMTRINPPSNNYMMTSFILDFDTETVQNEYLVEGWYAS